MFPSSKTVVNMNKEEITVFGLNRNLCVLIYMESFPLVAK